MNKLIYLASFFAIIFLTSAELSFAEQEDTMVDYKSKPDSYYKKNLSPEAFKVCRRNGTEKAYSGEYDKFYEKGTYMCACCGGDYPLFSSNSKFDSKTGWPSFWEPIEPNNVEYRKDQNLIHQFLGASTEVLCARCGSHLGHVFNDGPEPTGQRYCMNSVALRFVPEGNKVVRTFPEE